ncbi:MAG: DUF2062 domain-containing protein, partial [Myxococcota bacterium]|nr:DUF2062 domain-containing protein [Myxococcota bacterium]
GMAIGIFVGFLPIMSIQMAVSTMIAIPFRANLKAAVAAVWITNPLTFIPFYYGCYRFGLLLLPGDEVEWNQFKTALVHTSEWSWSNVRESLGNIVDIGIDILAPLWLGSTVLGIVFGVASYFVTLEAVERVRARAALRPKHDPA